MKVTICGGGSLGLAYACLMADAVAPRLYVRTQAQAARINELGITASMLGAESQAAVIASASSDVLSDADLVICLVKYPDTFSLRDDLKIALSPDATVVSLQTGIRPLLEYRSVLGAERVVGGVSYLGAKRTSDTSVELGQNLRTVLGLDTVSVEHADRVREFASRAARSDLEFELSDDIGQVIWQKLVVACSQNAVSALTGATFRRLRETPEWHDVLAGIISEVVAVAHAEGTDLPGDQLDRVFANWESLPGHRASTYTDLQLRRLTEVDALNGSIAELGHQHGIDIRLNELLTSMIHMAESARERR